MVSTSKHPSEDWRALTIYQVMVAAFQHSDTGSMGYKEMWGPDNERKDGNLRGVIEALDYIKGLGVNAIWLTPIFDSSEASGGEKLQASGYFASDFFKIDPHFGTEEDLHELVTEAHNRGIYVLLDGVFGHHGGVKNTSPSGHSIDSTPTLSVRGEEGGEGNVKYPESLEYFKEVATYWIDKFEIDGWRLDQAYQLCQEGHNYWCEISEAVHQLCERRRAEGKEWGVLGYMVGEVWTGAEGVNDSVYQDFGLKSAFDFDGKMRISGEMGDIGDAGLNNGWDDVVTTYSAPTERGYCSDEILPNLFLSNHDGYRVADRFYDEGQEINLMTRFAILAGYPGPVTLYYGDELADLSRDAEGSQPDNASRTTGRIAPDDDRERHLLNYVRDVFEFRKQNPAMWRGTQEFNRYRKDDAEVLVITKQDTESENKIVMVFADRDVTLNVEGVGEEVEVKGFVPQLFKLQ